MVIGTKINSVHCLENDLKGKTVHSLRNKRVKDYVKMKEENIPGPWAEEAYVANAPTLTNLGQENRSTKIPGVISYAVGGPKVDHITKTALIKRKWPVPH